MILILFQIVIEVGIYVMAIFRSVYMNDDLKLDHFSIGVFFASFLIVAAIIIRLARKIEGTLGERRALVFLYCSVFASFVIVFVVRSPIAIATQYLIYIVAGVQGPIINGYINRRVDSEHRSTVMAIATFTFTLLLMIVEIGAGYVATEWGLIESLMVLALTTAPVAMVLMVLWNKEIEREKAEAAHPSPT
jgi:MFS family permease